MKTLRLVIQIMMILFMAGFTSSKAGEIPICTLTSYQLFPAVSGNKIVWQDGRNGNADIYLYDLDTDIEIPICTLPSNQENPAISGNKIVWQDDRNGNYDIYLYDLDADVETPICTDPDWQYFPAISGNKIVWQDDRNCCMNSDIYLYDLDTDVETPICTNATFQYWPAISGNKIVWMDYRNGSDNPDIYLYDLDMGIETPICTDPNYQEYPKISGNKIVWEDWRNGFSDVYYYDLETKQETCICTNPVAQSSPAISGNKIVWVDGRNENSDIYLYDLDTSIESALCTNPYSQLEPAISGNNVVWKDYRHGDLNPDIFLYELGPPVTTSTTTTITASFIPDTGQTKCYDDSNYEVTSCPQPGEPFYGQDSQYVCNPQSYTKLDANGNDLPESATAWAMIRDNMTGLIWENKTDDGSIHDIDNSYNVFDEKDILVNILNSQNFGGYSDWRLPTIEELSNIIDSSVPYSGPTINNDFFPNTKVFLYWWSSTFDALDVYSNYCINFSDGSIYSQMTSNSGYIRAVRGVQTSNNYVDNLNGTITDMSTNLMWQKDTAPGTYTWEQALSYCESRALAGYNDWRLPNRNELQSIVDYGWFYSGRPLINPIFNAVSSNYWSSTTSAWIPAAAWYVNFLSGALSYKVKFENAYVRAVRGGQCRDSDDDGILANGDSLCTGGQITNCDDNCSSTPNGPLLGTCVKTMSGVVVGMGTTCNTDGDCAVGETCDLAQGDINGNGCGNACECYADCNSDQTVNLTDLVLMKQQYFRTDCATNPCSADCNSDNQVNLTDLVIMKAQYFSTDCPACP